MPDLLPPIAVFFAASNRHDADALAACFSPDGRVHDEQQDHRGRAAIRDWAEGTYVKYDVTLTPVEARGEGNETIVRTGVAGTFPGSPIELDFRFTVAGERIDELAIG